MSKQAGNSRYLSIHLLSLLYFTSGFTALIFQVLWLRAFALIIGNTIYAMGCVTTVFMLGMAIGSSLANRALRRSDYQNSLLKMYGCMEFLIGASGLLVTYLLFRFQEIWISMVPTAGTYSALGLAFNHIFLVTAAILLPSVAMGSTVPILAQLVNGRSVMARLYGVNTIGAAFGALAASFILIYNFGCINSAYAF